MGESMTDAATLRALAERVEAGETGGGLVSSVRTALRRCGAPVDCPAAAALRGSIDACAALHEVVLGGRWRLILSEAGDGAEEGFGPWCAEVWKDDDLGDQLQCHAKTPARAWLAAILKAKAAEMDG